MINYDDVRAELTAGKALPHFASQSGSSIREMTPELQMLGFEPLKTLPAQYHNWLLQRSTDQERNGADCLDSVVQELNALLEEFNVTPTDALKNQIITLLKTNYPQEFLSTVFLKLTGGTVDGDLHVKGDLTVDGIGEEIISTELKVGADTITLRNGNPTAMSSTELAGVITENYDGNGNNNILAIDSSGTARVGDIDIATRLLYSNDGTNFFEDEALTIPATIGQEEIVRDTGNTTSGGAEIYEGTTISNNNTQPITTRAEETNMTNGKFTKWNSAQRRIETSQYGESTIAGLNSTVEQQGQAIAGIQSVIPQGASPQNQLALSSDIPAQRTYKIACSFVNFIRNPAFTPTVNGGFYWTNPNQNAVVVRFTIYWSSGGNTFQVASAENQNHLYEAISNLTGVATLFRGSVLIEGGKTVIFKSDVPAELAGKIVVYADMSYQEIQLQTV